MDNKKGIGYKIGYLLGIVITICFALLVIAATAKLIFLMF